MYRGENAKDRRYQGSKQLEESSRGMMYENKKKKSIRTELPFTSSYVFHEVIVLVKQFELAYYI